MSKLNKALVAIVDQSDCTPQEVSFVLDIVSGRIKRLYEARAYREKKNNATVKKNG